MDVERSGLACGESEACMTDTLKILTPKDVAVMLGAGIQWVYARARFFGGKKIGGKWFFTEKGVRDAIEGGQDLEGYRHGRRTASKAEVRVFDQKSRGGMGANDPSGVGDDPNRHGFYDCYE